MNYPPSTDSLSRVIHKAIELEIDKLVTENTEEIKKKIETTLRANIARIAIKVAERFTLQQFGNTLRIEVDFNPDKR